MYLYAHYRDKQTALDALESMYAEGDVSPCEIAAVKPLPRSPHAKGRNRVGIYLKEIDEC